MNKGFEWTPARLTGLSFFTLIMLGAFFLALPVSTTSGIPASFVDALFTSASAVCVTGLTVQDTATYFSPFGQGVILALMQLGGLGIMTLSASLPILFGRQLKMSYRGFLLDAMDQTDYQNLRTTLTSIIKYTLIIELTGALIMALHWYTLNKNFPLSLYYGIFHSIAAFCNAGFALFSDNLVSYRGDIIINIVIMLLIILGGIGFEVLAEIFGKKHVRKLSTHAKMALIGTAILIFIPAIFIFFVEYSGSYLNYSLGAKIFTSLFQSVTARTAGFNTLDLNLYTDSSLFLICTLMFIGACPGGTGGGVKVTTVGILFLAVKAQLMGRDQIEVFGRRLTASLVNKASSIIIISFTIVNIFCLSLFLTETSTFKHILFETLSAFGTVGLSLGLTPELTTPGKLIVTLLMFVGRIGPLTLVFFIGNPHGKAYYQYPEGRVLVG